jgi:hypothetical protein
VSAPIVEKSSLAIGELIGDGGEGEVFEIKGQPNNVLKVFKDAVRHELSEAGLIATINIVSSMNSSEQTTVRQKSTWPHTLVRENGRFVGFVMPMLSADYFCRHGQKGNPIEGMNDWNKLTFRKAWISNQNLESDCPPLWYPDGTALDKLNDSQHKSREKLINLLLDTAELFEIFHRNKVVVGDVSGRNILWSRATGESVMLIDCDGCRIENTVGVTRAKQSPDWFDPVIGSTTPTNIESDLYKLTIALYRGYFADGLGMPGKNSTPLVNPEDKEFQQLALRGVSNTGRPSAAEWVSFLGRLKTASEFAGRPVIPDWRTPLPGEYVPKQVASPPPDEPRPNISIWGPT